jgi:phosphomannomutase
MALKIMRGAGNMHEFSRNDFLKLQNGNDVRGVVIGTEKEAVTLTPWMAGCVAEAFAGFIAEQKFAGATAEQRIAEVAAEQKIAEVAAGQKNSGVAAEQRTMGAAAEQRNVEAAAEQNNTGPGTRIRIGVGYDSRVTAEMMKAAVISGCGRNPQAEVFDCGLITTPAMFFSTILPESDFDGAIMITASHLPFNRNGMKFFTKDGALDKMMMTSVLEKAAAIAEAAANVANAGAATDQDAMVDSTSPATPSQSFDMRSVYSAHMRRLICEEVRAEDFEHPLDGLHIVEDAGNGAAGFFATDILEPLGADISGSVFLEPDGTFPNHVPNPEDRKAMEAASAAVLRAKADLGVIFDCDGDRGAVVFGDGKPVNRNRLIGLLASIIAEHYPGSTIVTDSVTSDELTNFLEDSLGLKHLRFKRGYKNVINKGIELNAAGEECRLAIETSGHGAFKENYFSDDGAYIAVRVIAKLAVLRREGKKLESLIEKLEDPAESIEVRYQIAGEDFAAYGGLVLEEFRAWAVEQPLFHVVEPNYEGVRIAFDDEEVKGWLLIRKSLHDPVLPMNIESKEAGGTDVILERINDFFARYKRLSV